MSKSSESEPKSLVLKPLVPSDVSQTLSEWKTSAVHFISKSKDEEEANDEFDDYSVHFVDLLADSEVHDTTNDNLSLADRVFLDPCANGCTLRDANLAINVTEEQRATRVTGSVPGGLIVRTHGEFACFGTTAVHPQFTKNILSQNAVESAGYEIFITKVNKKIVDYQAVKPGHPTIVFPKDNKELYSITIDAFMASLPQYYPPKVVSAQQQDIAHVPPKLTLTTAQRERAQLARAHHVGCL